MSAPAETLRNEDQLLAFDVGGAIYALPIACVAEVAEVEPLASIPTLPAGTAGVMNHHGDALPVLQRSVLFDLPEALPDPTHVLVVMPRTGGGPRFGIFADRILGLVNGCAAQATGTALVAVKRSIDGRMVFVLDPERFFARAGEAIENSLERSG